jgi:hypothetical protein
MTALRAMKVILSSSRAAAKSLAQRVIRHEGIFSRQ